MATKKVTVTLDEDTLVRIRELVSSGASGSISGFVQRAVVLALDDAAAYRTMLDDALGASGGPLTADERRWAEAALGAGPSGPRASIGMTTGVTLDAGALIALERGERAVLSLLATVATQGQPVTVPATALAQVVRQPHRQVRLARLLREPRTSVVGLDRAGAVEIGRLLATSGTSDVVDAHVVACARRAGQPVATSDPDDLRLLDPSVPLIPV